MAFTAVTQVDGLRLGSYYCTFFRGTAGASGNTLVVNFTVDFIFGCPNATFTQSGGTVTISGLTNTNVDSLLLVGRTAA